VRAAGLFASHDQRQENAMPRLTRARANGEGYVVDADQVRPDGDGWAGAAVDRLAAFENLHDDLVASQRTIAAELDALRDAGKKNTVRFKELVAKRLVNQTVLALFEQHHLR